MKQKENNYMLWRSHWDSYFSPNHLNMSCHYTVNLEGR